MAAILVNFSVLSLIIGISTLIKGCCKLHEAQAAAVEARQKLPVNGEVAEGGGLVGYVIHAAGGGRSEQPVYRPTAHRRCHRDQR